MKRFPLGGVHLMHAALSRSEESIKSGTSPVYINSHKAHINEIAVHGNTENGIGVGDKTINLFRYASAIIVNNNGTILQQTDDHIIAKGNEGANPGGRTNSNGWLVISGVGDIPANTVVTVSGSIRFVEKHPNSGDRIVFGIYGLQANLFTVDIPAGGRCYTTFTVPNDVQNARIWLSLNSSTIEVSNIQLSLGSHVLPYEPYGCKIPVSIKDRYTGKMYSFDHYIPDPLYSPSDTTVITPEPDRFASPIITVGTSVAPSQVVVKYTS